MKLIAESSAGLGQKRSRLGSDSLSSLSRMTRSSYTPLLFPHTESKISCKTLNQTNLYNGSFNKKLAILVKCTHLPPIPCSRHSECQLHQLANKRTRKQVMTCNDCNATLCISCYKPFHSAYDLNMIKADIEDDRGSTIKTIIPFPSSFKIEFQIKSI